MDLIEFAGLAVGFPAGDEFGKKACRHDLDVFWAWTEHFPSVFVLTVIQAPYSLSAG
jgi:hypothetical protein